MRERTVYHLLSGAAEQFGTAAALHQPILENGVRGWRSLNWIEYKQAVDEIAAGLMELGIESGDTVALNAETSLEFYLSDLAIMACGGIAAALYTSYPAADLVKTLRCCDAKAVFVESPKVLAALLSAADPSLDTKWILMSGDAEEASTLDKLRASGRAAIQRDSGYLKRRTDELRPSDHAILYLTSGATGEPKMGLVSHSAIVANVDMAPQVASLGPEHCSVAFLPSAHITQRLAMELLPIRVGMPVYFSEGLSRLPHELKSVRPTFFVAPPRVWERMYTSISAEIRKRGAVTQRIFYGALGLGLEIARRKQAGRSVPGWMERLWKLADRAVFAKIRERLGGRLEIAVSGAAPLGKDMADFYAAIGLPIHEGYGLTEGGILALNPIGRFKSGSIGKALPGVEIKIASDGELLFRSPSLFAGYYRDAAATQDVLRDGWLHTGDVAEVDAEGYIYITGRKKEVLVSSNGKKIYPALIEGLFKMEPLVNQVLLVGDKLPYVGALFTLNIHVAETLKGMESYAAKAPEEIVKAPPVTAELKALVSRVNKQLAPFEQIRKYVVLPRDFTIEAGEITPTMKVRRARVFENHREAIGELYAGREDAI